jgi:hypothetical protein
MYGLRFCTHLLLQIFLRIIDKLYVFTVFDNKKVNSSGVKAALIFSMNIGLNEDSSAFCALNSNLTILLLPHASIIVF